MFISILFPLAAFTHMNMFPNDDGVKIFYDSLFYAVLFTVIYMSRSKFLLSGTRAVCIYCGFLKKKNFYDPCERCRARPLSEEDLAKAFILSTRKGYKKDVVRTKDLEDFSLSGNMIEKGEKYPFDSNEIEVVSFYLKTLKLNPGKDGLI